MRGQLGFFQKLEDVPDSDIKDVAYGALDQDWSPPAGFPRGFEDADIISIDLETSDPNKLDQLAKKTDQGKPMVKKFPNGYKKRRKG